MSYSPNRSGIYLPDRAQKFVLGAGLPSDVQSALSYIVAEFHKGSRACRTVDLGHLARLMDQGDDVFGNDFFPMPDGYSAFDWAEIKSRLMVIVNLLQASVRKVRNRVYGGYQIREVIKNPYKAEMESFLSGWHSVDMREWFTNRIAYSNAPCVLVGRQDSSGRKRIMRWLPDPCYTYLATHPMDHRDYGAVAEFSPDGQRMQFVTADSEGVLYAGSEPVVLGPGDKVPPAGSSYVRRTDMGFLPAVVAHGQSRRNRRNPYSEPPFKSAIKFTLRATDILFNGSLLQKIQTKGLLAINGVQERETMDFSEMMRQGVVYLDPEGKIQFVVPQSNIKDTLELLDELIEVYSVVHAIPVDDLNPSSAKGTSAEEANRRAEPHLSLSREYAELSTLDETELCVRATGVFQWLDGKSVDLDALRDEVETEIDLQPPMKPLTSQSDAQIAQVGYEIGAILPEDMALAWNPRGSKRKLAAVRANMEKIAGKKAAQAARSAENTGGKPDNPNSEVGSDEE